MDKKYKVCVICATFNHGPYIKTALEGFSIQQTKFPYVSVIVDDASTDNTADEIRQYMSDNFDLQEASYSCDKDTEYGHVSIARHKTNKNCTFVVVYLKENHYSKRKSKNPYTNEWMASAEYIAYCEGDDYWTDPNKLQLQTEAMDKHPDVDISAHPYLWVNALNGEVLERVSLSSDYTIFSTEQVIMGEGGYVGTPTLMMRQSLWRKREHFLFWKMMDYDYSMQIAGALEGGLLYLKDCMVDKRTGVPGSFTSKHRVANKAFNIDYNNRKIDMLQQLDKDTGGKYHDIINARILLNSIRSYNTSKENREYLNSFRSGLKNIKLSKKLSMMVLSYFSIAVFIYRLLRYGK